MDFVNFFFFFPSWSRTFKPTKISLVFFFFSFIGKDLDKRSHLSQQSLHGCVCVCECREPLEGRGCPGVPAPPAHTHPHTPPTPDAIPNLDYFVSALQVNTVQLHTVCLSANYCLWKHICGEKQKQQQKKKTGFSRVLVPPGYLLSIFVITYLLECD